MDPRYHVTAWEQSSTHKDYPQLQLPEICDVVVVGAGITGLTAALLLKKEGRRVIVVEAQQVGSGTTGGTSAHLSTLYDQDYRQIEHAYGRDMTALVASSLQKGIALIGELAQEHAIACELKEVPAYLYTERVEKSADVAEECAAARAAGLPVAMSDSVPLPFPVVNSLRAEGQAQFHPLQYLQGLAAAFVGDGCKIYEHSPVTKVQELDDGTCLVKTAKGQVSAPALVLATNTPLGVSFVQTQLTALRSCILAFTSTCRLPDALFYDCADPYHYVRSQDTERGRVIIVGGADRRVGHGEEEDSFKALEAYARRRFSVDDIIWRWSAQFYEPADLLPYIGLLPSSKRQYIGTGYSGDGLVLGSTAGWMITEQICGRASPYDELYHPARLRLHGVRDVMALGFDGVTHAVSDRMPHFDARAPEDLAPGEGGIMQLGLRKVAAYREPSGQLHQFSAVCPHMQAIVHWNKEQRTFDCPWHGSRFDHCGQAIEGPCTAALAKIEERKQDQPKPQPQPQPGTASI